jgi:dihydropteroate synthase
MGMTTGKETIFRLGDRLINLRQPAVMGVVNLNDDSFFPGSRVTNPKRLVEKVESMLMDGAQIIDLGAVSSRPGSNEVSESEEWERLLPVLQVLKTYFPGLLLSLDTFRSGITQRAFDCFGPFVVNDIYGGSGDDHLWDVAANLHLPYILMHMKGNPATMQAQPVYDDVNREIMLFFAERIKRLFLLGLSDVWLDPGFGFGKTLEHNYHILNNLGGYSIFNLPIVVGISRKTMIYRVIDAGPEEALAGSIAAATWAAMQNCAFLRVHDVKAANDLIRVASYFKLEL